MRKTREAFIWITTILKENNLEFRISGGLAARVYGVKRKLADIDVEVYEKDISTIYKKVKDFVIFGPKRYKDENWDLMLMTLEYEGQEIDIAAVESKIFSQKTKRWIKKPGSILDSNLIKFFNINVPIEKKEALINYKEMLSREVDIEDVKQLKKGI